MIIFVNHTSESDNSLIASKNKKYYTTNEGFFEEIADGQINACKSAMFEKGDYEVSCLFRNCSVKTSVWHLLETTQKENKPMQAEWNVLELSLLSCVKAYKIYYKYMASRLSSGFLFVFKLCFKELNLEFKTFINYLKLDVVLKNHNNCVTQDAMEAT
ncbi:hypothetical protein BpHYR1_049656 [Brachionus plicatilis]|uniref:Uncharacterized protein n=1 Tax=Brachionus plicatilis TaxID=10195 RepID=A0A3M7R5F3_BRAPC|nr:hypothetical protein BpHYR1_049656 [Brachionus plicatilis]